MGSLKKRRKAKINKHKRRKKLRCQSPQEAHLAEVAGSPLNVGNAKHSLAAHTRKCGLRRLFGLDA